MVSRFESSRSCSSSVDRERLRLVDHHDATAARLALREQVRVQRVDQLHLAAGRAGRPSSRLIAAAARSAESAGLKT